MRQYRTLDAGIHGTRITTAINIGYLFTLHDFTSAEIESLIDMPIGASLMFDSLIVERILDAPDKKCCPSCGQPLPE
jgi:hypothetical protein